jgi:hypothetical protein
MGVAVTAVGRVSDPDPDPNPDSHSKGSWIRIRIQKGKNQPKKRRKISLKTRKNMKKGIFYAVIFKAKNLVKNF